MESIPEAGGAALLGSSSSRLIELENALEEHFGAPDISETRERRIAPIEGHTCRCAIVAMAVFAIDAVTDIVNFLRS